jgi:acyl dehydratase
MAAVWAFEDFKEGATIELGSATVTAEEIVEFAGEFDPQAMHLDEEAGRQSMLGGLSASGWHSCAIFMRLFCDGFLLASTSQGSPGVDFVRWKKPVLAGDRLTARMTVLSKRLSRSRPSLGLVALRSGMSNQRGESVLELENTIMFQTRQAAAAG